MTFLTSETFQKFSEFIYRKSGIFLEEDKHFSKLNKVLQDEAISNGFDNFRKYFFKLRFEDRDGQIFQHLMNKITVNETYFFRENDQFEVLVNDILPFLDRIRPKDEPIRILSAPSSTGEEPYSMVIHILEESNLIEHRDIEIIGIDIDTTVIEKAQKALYSDRSVHAIPKHIYPKYFIKKGFYNQLNEDYKEAVDFRVVNVFDKNQVRNLGKFDVIFSRNMLIYFDDASRKEVAMSFYTMLNPQGFVFLGHAEYMSRIVSVFKAKKVNNTLVYQK